MDTDMVDAGFDIDLGLDEPIETYTPAPQQIAQQNTTRKNSNDIPAAYLEDLSAPQQKPWPESLNLQGVSDFDPNDALYYAMEHCGAEPRVKQLRWVNDNSVNLEFYSAEDAAAALVLLTHPDVMNAGNLLSQDSRIAKPFSKKPNSLLRVRETNSGDQKPRGAGRASNYYQRNPDVAGNRQREPRRREPMREEPTKKDFLDYGDDDVAPRDQWPANNRDKSMGEGDGGQWGNRQDDRDTGDFRGREPRGNWQRDDREFGRPRDHREPGRFRDDREQGGFRNDRASGRFRDDRAPGRLRVDSEPGRLRTDREPGRLGDNRAPGRPREDVDSYRPGSRSPRESRSGRLRGRSASPASNDEGDGRFGFAEDNTNIRTRYRSRSRSRNDARRRRATSGERWAHDKFGTASGGRWQKDAYTLDSSPMGNHRRSDAFDGGKSGSLLARMTKDGQPLAPPKRSLADRMTRDDDDDTYKDYNEGSSYGRLKGDNSQPSYHGFEDREREQRPKRSLVDRVSRDTEMNIRGRGQIQQEGINIRGQAANLSATEGINIRGVASGA